MRKLTGLLILPLLCILMPGCKEQAPDPLQQALKAYILQGEEGTFQLYRIEKIDSTTFRTEFERRQNVYELKLKQENKLYRDYLSQNKPKNAKRHSEAIVRTCEIMNGLDSLKAGMKGRLDDIAYYDYVFSAKASSDSQYSEFQSAYVSITPAYEIITLTEDRKDLHKAGGRAIPGYLQLLGQDAEEE